MFFTWFLIGSGLALFITALFYPAQGDPIAVRRIGAYLWSGFALFLLGALLLCLGDV